jgi:hypothetical protein
MTALNEFIEELEHYCYTTTIVTFLNRMGQEFRLDLKREVRSDRVRYGYVAGLKEVLKARLQQGGIIILRSFTEEIDSQTHLPIKEIRGYVITTQNNDIIYQRLLPDDLFWSSTTDPHSGKRLAPEPAVRYC